MRQRLGAQTRLTAEKAKDYRLEPQLSQVVVMELRFFEHVRQAVQILWQGQPLVLNLTQLDLELAQRAVDFVAGATCAIDGQQQYLAPRLFLFAPQGVELANAVDETA
jgi:cell division inhibitor SepF